jgi:hypothetical protein
MTARQPPVLHSESLRTTRRLKLKPRVLARQFESGIARWPAQSEQARSSVSVWPPRRHRHLLIRQRRPRSALDSTRLW